MTVKLCKLGMVNRNAEARAKLLRQIEALSQGIYGMSIDSERCDELLLALVRPVLERELRARIKQLEADLAAMGVEI